MPRGGALLVCVLAACAEVTPADVAEQYPTPIEPKDGLGSFDGALVPLPNEIAHDTHKFALGERLFADKRLSGDGKVACTDCHALDQGGSNGMARSALPDRNPVGVNVPTVFNLAFNFRFAWSGKFTEVGEQIDAALRLPEAMGGTWSNTRAAIEGDPDYVRDFTAVYPEGITEGSTRDALVTYTLSLVTPGSRFDRHLQGDGTLTANELRGYAMFRDYGCISCHQGQNIGGNMFQRFGVMEDYFADHETLSKGDLGLYAATEEDDDKHVFRVPSLRNVALTAPYFHDGSAATLNDAVQTMARYQLGRALTEEQVADIVAFLETLTGTLQGRPL